MLKKGFFYSSLIGCIAFLSAGFKPVSSDYFDWFHLDKNNGVTYIYPSQKLNDYKNLSIPFTGRYFIGFKEALAFRESQGKYQLVNSLGYMGKYQFGTETLKSLGIVDSVAFLNSPKLQEKAFLALIAKNKWRLQKQIDQYEGKIVGGVKITESGLLAAAHLGGAGSVKRFLKSDGKYLCKDQFGTSIKVYLTDFGGYETQGISANRYAKVK